MVGILLLGAFSLSNAGPGVWEKAGTVSHLFIGDSNAWIGDTDNAPKCIVTLSSSVNFTFPINGDLGKAWLSELLTARAGGQLVTVELKTTVDKTGYYRVNKIWVQ